MYVKPRKKKRNPNRGYILLVCGLVIILAGLIFLCIALFSGMIGGPAQPEGPTPVPVGNASLNADYAIGSLPGDHVYGSTKAATFEEGGAARIEYPYMGQLQLDHVIGEKVNAIYEEFRAKAGNSIADCRLDTRYEAIKVSERFAGVVFISELTNSKNGRRTRWTDTLSIDSATGESFGLYQLINDDGRDMLGATCAAAAEKAGYPNGLDKNDFIYTDDGYSNFILAQDGMHLFFDPAAGETGITDISVPYDYLAPGMRALPDGRGTLAPATAVPSASPVHTDEPEATPEETPAETLSPTPSPEATPTPSPTNTPEAHGTPVSGQKMVAFSFDDGPDNVYTNRILDALEQYNAKATFFMVGMMFEGRENTVKRVYDLGCEIGNHTMHHEILNRMGTKEEFDAEVEAMNDALEALTGIRTKLIRPPGGGANDKVKGWSQYPLILWSVDPEDWNSRDADKVYNAVMSETDLDGKVILMHDIYESSAVAVERLLPELISRGYKIVTVSELIESGGYKMKPGHVYGRRITQ